MVVPNAFPTGKKILTKRSFACGRFFKIMFFLVDFRFNFFSLREERCSYSQFQIVPEKLFLVVLRDE